MQCQGLTTRVHVWSGGGGSRSSSNSSMAVRLWSSSVQGLLRVRFPRTRTVAPCYLFERFRKYFLFWVLLEMKLSFPEGHDFALLFFFLFFFSSFFIWVFFPIVAVD
jgi:hypothetical protein